MTNTNEYFFFSESSGHFLISFYSSIADFNDDGLTDHFGILQ